MEKNHAGLGRLLSRTLGFTMACILALNVMCVFPALADSQMSGYTDPMSVPADGTTAAAGYVRFTNGGTPVQGRAITFTVENADPTKVKLGNTSAVTDENGYARYTVTSSVQGTYSVRADSGYFLGRTSTIFTAIPASVELAAAHPVITGNSSSATELTVTVRDAGGNPVADSTINWSTDLQGGTLAPTTVRTGQDGKAKTTLTNAGGVRGYAHVTATVAPDVMSATTTVTLAGVTGISPRSCTIGDSVTLTGYGFGSSPGEVRFQQRNPSTYAWKTISVTNNFGTWSDTSVTVPVPAGLDPGDVANVTIYNPTAYEPYSGTTGTMLPTDWYWGNPALTITASLTSATLSPTSVSFDKNASKQADVSTTVTWNSASSVTDVKNAGSSIGAASYSLSGATLTIKKAYLAAQSVGALKLSVAFDKGSAAELTVNISDTTRYTISAAPNNASYGSVTGAGSYAAGAAVTLKAIPKAGYRFVRWLEGATQVSSSYEYKFTVTKSRALKAEFAAIGVPALSAAVAGYDSVKLTWRAVAGAAGYEVYRAASSAGAYTRIATVTATSCTNTGLATGTTYYYKVRAKCAAGSVTTYGGYSAPKAAKPILAVPVLHVDPYSYTSLRLTWAAVPGATKYEVYRAASLSGTYTKLAETASVSYLSTGLVTGKAYYYKVRAYRMVGRTKVYGGYSAIVTRKPVPATPAGLKAARASSTSIRLTWGGVAGATKYEVYRSTSASGAYTKLTETASISYISGGLRAGTTYYYKVRAYHLESGVKIYGAFSVIVYAKP